LINSIKQKGVITPITVRKIRSGYELVAGERRWRASKKANLKLIPAYVIDVKNQSDIMELALTENIQREDLNPIEESEAYELLHQKYDMSHEMIGKSVGKSRVAISNSIRLLQLPPSIRKSIRLGEISSGHGRAILQAKTIKQMELIWSKIKKDKISVRDAELMVKNKKSSKNKQKKYNARNKEIVNLENRLIETFKTKVRIKSRKNGGCIEVFYFSNKELDRILNILNGED
jgi:ParB family chromosome partitioning protein